jgi:hypothetical protein
LVVLTECSQRPLRATTFYVCLVVYEAGHDYRSKDLSAARIAVPV